MPNCTIYNSVGSLSFQPISNEILLGYYKYEGQILISSLHSKYCYQISQMNLRQNYYRSGNSKFINLIKSQQFTVSSYSIKHRHTHTPFKFFKTVLTQRRFHFIFYYCYCYYYAEQLIYITFYSHFILLQLNFWKATKQAED